MNKIETLATEIMNEFAKDNDPITFEEACEMAKMELKEKANRRYEKADTPRKQTERKRKIDEEKKGLIETLEESIRDASDTFPVIKNESEFSFTHNGSSYTVKLIKHRPKKQGGFKMRPGPITKKLQINFQKGLAFFL